MVRNTIEERILRGQRKLKFSGGSEAAAASGAGSGGGEGSPTKRHGGAGSKKKDQDVLDIHSIRYLLGLPQR